MVTNHVPEVLEGAMVHGRDWVDLLQTFGLATMIILFIGLCIWKGSAWIGENVIKKIVEKYVVLLDALIASVTKQGDTMTKVGSTLEKEGDTLSKVGNVLEKLGGTLDQMGQHVIKSMSVLEHISEGVAELRSVKEIKVQGVERVEVHSPNETNIATQPSQQQNPSIQPRRKSGP